MTYKTTRKLERDGTLELNELPFHAGEQVEVRIEPVSPPPAGNGFPLRGSVIRFDDPLRPVAADDWECSG